MERRGREQRTLHTANQVMVLRVRALSVSECRQHARQASGGEHVRNDTKCVVFLHGASTNAAEESLLHAALEAHDGNLWRGLKIFVSASGSTPCRQQSGRTSSMSTSTCLVQIHGSTIHVVIPMTYQKSCCLTRCLPLRFQVLVVGSNRSPMMTKAPREGSSAPPPTKNGRGPTCKEQAGPADKAMVTLENAR